MKVAFRLEAPTKGDLELSSRTERSAVKDLVYILVGVFETLRFALSDNNVLDL